MLKPALLEPVIFELMPLEPVSRPFYLETCFTTEAKAKSQDFRSRVVFRVINPDVFPENCPDAFPEEEVEK